MIGRDFDLALLERVASLEEDQFLNALDEALAGGLVVQAPRDPGRYSFSHALIRETLYEGMSSRAGHAITAASARRSRLRAATLS